VCARLARQQTQKHDLASFGWNHEREGRRGSGCGLRSESHFRWEGGNEDNGK